MWLAGDWMGGPDQYGLIFPPVVMGYFVGIEQAAEFRSVCAANIQTDTPVFGVDSPDVEKGNPFSVPAGLNVINVMKPGLHGGYRIGSGKLI